MSNGFVFRFPSEELKRQFKVRAFNLDKSMNELLGEIVVQYMENNKEVA